MGRREREPARRCAGALMQPLFRVVTLFLRMERGVRSVLVIKDVFNGFSYVTPCNAQSIWGGTFKDEKAGLQQKFTERGVVSTIALFHAPAQSA